MLIELGPLAVISIMVVLRSSYASCVAVSLSVEQAVESTHNCDLPTKVILDFTGLDGFRRLIGNDMVQSCKRSDPT